MQVFISAHTNDVPIPVRRKRSDRLGAYLRLTYGRHNVAYVRGSYEGVEEESWRVDLTDFTHHDASAAIDQLQGVAYLLQQDSILLVHPDQTALLVFTNDAHQFETGENYRRIGTLVLTTESVARSHGAWSCVDGQWFIVE